MDLDLRHLVRDGDTIVLGQGAGEPVALTRALLEQRESLGRVTVFCGLVYSGLFRPEHADHLRFRGYGAFAGLRTLAAAGVLDVVRRHLSEIPDMFLTGELAADVVFLQVAPADERGFHSLGVTVDYLPAALSVARTVVAEVNTRMPVTAGPCRIHTSRLDAVVETSRPLLELPVAPRTENDERLGGAAAELVDDGSTIEVGVGSTTEAVVRALAGRRDLGLHSGLLTDGVMDLMIAGALTNRRKEIDTGVSVAGLAMGTEALYRFVDRNPAIELHPATYTHGAGVLQRLGRFVAINGALEVDLEGNVNAEVAAGRPVGGIGGQGDFARAASASPGGRSIIVLRATTPDGTRSRIVSSLDSGTVTTPASYVDHVVTEFGAASLRGLSPERRRAALIGIAHPDLRAALQDDLTTLS